MRTPPRPVSQMQLGHLLRFLVKPRWQRERWQPLQLTKIATRRIGTNLMMPSTMAVLTTLPERYVCTNILKSDLSAGSSTYSSVNLVKAFKSVCYQSQHALGQQKPRPHLLRTKGGRERFPTSVAGFMQQKSLKSGCRSTG